MEWRGVVSLSVCVSVIAVSAQVGSLCRPNERLLYCGCPRTCSDPVPDCRGVCKEGCFCEEGQVRNETGHCVGLAECPPIPSAYKLDTSEPRAPEEPCPIDEEYRFCEPCHRTCDEPNPVCPAQCARGCFCRAGLVRDLDGRCVKYEKCSRFLDNESVNLIKPIPYKMTCGPHQVFKDCETCERTCNSPFPKCLTLCKRGCFCKEGHAKTPNGDCVLLEKCPTGSKFEIV